MRLIYVSREQKIYQQLSRDISFDLRPFLLNLVSVNTFKQVINSLKSFTATLVILLSVVVAWLIYVYVLGDSLNFVGGSNLNEPLKNNYLGVIYKGGPIVVLLITFQIVLLTYIVERFFSISKASGRSKDQGFVLKIRSLLERNRVDEAMETCDQQKGSVANVIKNGLQTFKQVIKDEEMSRDDKIITLHKDIEEATQLELPQLNKNLAVISTLASISTLVGLLGTVTGMIKAFSALARVGTPDAVGLAGGISQALVTTALGISTAAVAVVFYNYFTVRIDRIAYAIDEASFSIINIFKTRAK